MGGICTGGVGWNDLVPIYNKPIAILTGPGAISAADFFVRILKFYPKSRTFGKSTSSAFGSPVWINTGINGWFCKYSVFNFAFVDSSLLYKDIDPYLDNVQLLARTILDVDEEVWLTPEDVRNGKDTVVETAISWIQSQATYVSHHDKANFKNFNIIKNFPNPFNNMTYINFSLTKPGYVELDIFDLNGKLVTTLIAENLSTGNHVVKWSPKNCASGIYCSLLKIGDSYFKNKMLYLK